MMRSPKDSVVVLVIDDQVSRKIIYQKCVEAINVALQGKLKLELRFCESQLDVMHHQPQKGIPTLAIVDMVLDGSGWTAKGVRQVDELLCSSGWPLMLVSAKFGAPEAMERANGLIADATSTSQFVLWSTFERAAEGTEVGELAFIVTALVRGSAGHDVAFSKRPEDPIDVLHITDAHFGLAAWNAGLLALLRAERNRHDLGPADFIAITGDIANEGSPEQYTYALEYLQGLALNEIVVQTDAGGLPPNRVFVCPGNHDFSRPVALAANIGRTPPYAVETSVVSGNEWIRSSYAWAAYEDFESRVAGPRARWTENPGYRVDRRFAPAGIVVLELNVERYAIDGYQKGTDDAAMLRRMNSASDAVRKSRAPGECLIVLAHRHESDAWKAAAQFIETTISGFAADGPVILLCGHEHAATVGVMFKDTTLVVQGVPPISGASRPSNVLPTLHWLRLLRKAGAIVGVRIIQFHQEASKWLSDQDRQYAWRDGIWSAERSAGGQRSGG